MKVELAHNRKTIDQLRQGDTFLMDGMAYCLCYDSKARSTDSHATCFRFDGALVTRFDRGAVVEPRPMKVVDDVETERDGKETDR